MRLVLIAFLAAAAACQETGAKPLKFEKGEQKAEASFGDSLIPSLAEEQLKKERALGSDLARTLERLDGVEEARVHLILADRSILAPDRREKSKAAIVIKRSDGTGPTEKTIRALAAAAVSGLKEAEIRVFFTEPSRQPSKTVFVGPIEVAEGSAATAKICLGGLLILCLVLAGCLVAAGIKLKRLRRRTF